MPAGIGKEGLDLNRATSRRGQVHGKSSGVVVLGPLNSTVPVAVGVGGGIDSGLAPDVEVVGVEDEVGASLSVSDESPEERRTQVADSVHVRGDVWCRHSGQQVIDLTADQYVFASEAGCRIGQARRSLEEVAIEPVGTLGDVDVLTKVARELHQSDVNTLGPARRSAVAGAAMASSSALIDSRSSARCRRSSSRKACSDEGEVDSIEPLPDRRSLTSVARFPLPGDPAGTEQARLAGQAKPSWARAPPSGARVKRRR